MQGSPAVAFLIISIQKKFYYPVEKNYKAVAEFMGEATKEYSGVDFMKQAGINSIYRQLTNIKFPPKHSS